METLKSLAWDGKRKYITIAVVVALVVLAVVGAPDVSVLAE